MRLSSSRLGLALGLAGLFAVSAAANPVSLPLPEGPVLLTVAGLISETNVEDEAQFDLPMLEDLGTVTMITTTPWTIGPQHFEGVPLRVVLDRVGAKGDLIFAEAYNDYNSELPISDAAEDGAMIAFRMNGKEMTLRDKGPLWIVFNYDEEPTYRSETYMTRSIWQLDRLTIKDTQDRGRP